VLVCTEGPLFSVEELTSISLLMPVVRGSEGFWERGVSLFIAVALIFLGLAGERFAIGGYLKGTPPEAKTVPRWVGRLVLVPLGIWVLYRAFF